MIVSFLLMGCKKAEFSEVDFNPPNDKMGVVQTDTFSLEASTITEPYLRTDYNQIQMLGSLNDPIFGKTEAAIATQFSIPTINPNFSGAVVDSVVLCLAYETQYGSTSNALSYEVFEITEPLSDTLFYSNKIPVFSAINLTSGIQAGIPRIKDSVFVEGKNQAPHIRIRLNKSLGEKLFALPTSAYDNHSNFVSHFKGLYIKAYTINPSDTGTVIGYNLLSTTGWSNLTVYYTLNDTVHKRYRFTISSSCKSYSVFTHNYAGTQIANDTASTTKGSERLYLQALAGLKVKIKIPGLETMKTMGRFSIAKAELIIPIENSGNAYLSPPSKLNMAAFKQDGSLSFLTDAPAITGGGGGLENESYFGGNLSNNQYRFNIARYVQEIITGQRTQYGLCLVISGAATRGNRVVLKGTGKHLPERMKLVLTYVNL